MANNIIIIMAGGLGKRMQSEIPKVLHKIQNKPMLVHIIEQSLMVKPQKIFIVVGKYKNIIQDTLKQFISLDSIEFIYQAESLGTGHAILCCRDKLLQFQDSNILILSGDTPMIKSSTIDSILSTMKSVSITTTSFENPKGYGRILEKNKEFLKITEDKDCSEEEKKIKKVNCGIYAFKCELLCKYLPFLSNQNAQNEFYLTDIIELIKKGENISIDMIDIPTHRQIEIIGVNSKEQLNELEVLIKPFSLEQKYESSDRWSYL
jgi:UDP-N-acetylglucosamine diphosphorylase/glucosamine-1-phosphate N-acetyltransferase